MKRCHYDRVRWLCLWGQLLLVFSWAAQAQIPAGYYDRAAGKSGGELRWALHMIDDAGINPCREPALKTAGMLSGQL